MSIRLTGDIDSVANANNLAMVALTARIQHEHNYDERGTHALVTARALLARVLADVRTRP